MVRTRTLASRLPLSRLGRPGSTPALVQPVGGMAVRNRKGATAERVFCRQLNVLHQAASCCSPLRYRDIAIHRLTWNPAESLVCDVSRQPNVLRQTTSCFRRYDIRDIAIHLRCVDISLIPFQYLLCWRLFFVNEDATAAFVNRQGANFSPIEYSGNASREAEVGFEPRTSRCSTLLVPSCHATRRKHEGWDTARLLTRRQRKSRGGGRIRTTDLPVSKFADLWILVDRKAVVRLHFWGTLDTNDLAFNVVTPFRCLSATRRKHEDWDTAARFPKPRQEKSRRSGRVRTEDFPISQSALQLLRHLTGEVETQWPGSNRGLSDQSIRAPTTETPRIQLRLFGELPGILVLVGRKLGNSWKGDH
ncbi:hypothetical protein T265_05678 [Opisthorchis viverrini]|uniref:Uncharacterized protein n=1 Tax=Opisthorchis viverrini TaxID=6198 RepID=A0A074ZNE2_OPIVI|nr:hypothetical protein T265_05678 [Opisthorchis viverrini]KER27277.1 hypothetical protein T265_05678 [Opisthorchis viverrini]